MTNKTLGQMLKDIKNSHPLYQPSDFWISMNSHHLKQLNDLDLKNFKRSVNMKYFNWGILGIIRHQLHVIIDQLRVGNFEPFFKSSFDQLIANKGVKHFNLLGGLIYRLFVASFYDLNHKEGHPNDKLIELEEPLVGNPFIVRYKGKLISQDLVNSIHEFTTIFRYLNKLGSKKIRIAELGSGYGRLGFVFLKLLSKSKYTFIDIPPALFIAQNYISSIFPEEKIFKYRPFSTFAEVETEFEQARIRFLMPYQIELLPEKYFDLFINISSLHEMTRDRIKNYVDQINRLTKHFFYTKQWRKSRTKDNDHIKEKEYPIPKKWKVIMRRSPHPIQKMFFDALYKIV